MAGNYIAILAAEMNVAAWQVEKTLELLDGGVTVPFILRYRKEKTGTLDEVHVAQVRGRVVSCESWTNAAKPSAILPGKSATKRPQLFPLLLKIVLAVRLLNSETVQ